MMNESDPTVEQTFRVEEIILHDGFVQNGENFNNDIGMSLSIEASLLIL